MDIINGWTKRKRDSFTRWRNELEYHHTVNWFFLYQLKYRENFWAWCLIIISTIASTASLVNLEAIYEEDKDLSFYLNVFNSFTAVSTALLASWMKKENYVERINLVDRHIQRLSKLNVELTYHLSKEPGDRMSYETFIEVYEDQITDLLSSNPPMAPREFKKAVYILTTKYPEITKNTYPWYDKDIESGRMIKTSWGHDIKKSYPRVFRLNSLISKKLEIPTDSISSSDENFTNINNTENNKGVNTKYNCKREGSRPSRKYRRVNIV